MNSVENPKKINVGQDQGIRKMMIIASTGTFLGAWTKVLSVSPNRFYLVFIGQAFQAVFENATFCVAARFTAVWFGAKEIAIAGALALFGDQVGGALGFKLPSLLVENSSDMKIVEAGLRRMHLIIAGVTTLVLTSIILFFKEKPPLPPSVAQTLQNKMKSGGVMKSITSIFKMPSYLLILLSYSLCMGSFNAFAVLLNQTGRGEAVGNIGLILMVSGMAGSLVTGYFLDKTHLFKESAVFLTTCSAFSIGFFTWSLKCNNIIYIYAISLLIGFCIQGFYAMGVQMAIEVTYPVTEDISSAMMLLCVHITSLILTSTYGFAVKQYGDLKSNISLVVVFSISAVFTLLIPANLKRQKIEKFAKTEEIKEFI